MKIESSNLVGAKLAKALGLPPITGLTIELKLDDVARVHASFLMTTEQADEVAEVLRHYVLVEKL